ncbi:longevity assurance proteins LAG1/LAC1 [Lentinula edodes]|uniref:longevity assurance proteins LAG1/LAC1 n=1 Tax=Lentinula edodes TaxID=5353 RepID=UPI001E8EEDDE|nr:longevity assurance proteins LAG1/LAC1 [Lentinula edodes]KAH7876279.1 longevity assurance proteins LAG1/LAC1 [Lentinula edodes]
MVNKKSSLTMLSHIEQDPAHHLAGPFLPQTPIGSLTPERSNSPDVRRRHQPRAVNPFLRWAVVPVASLKVLLVPIILYVNWQLVSPILAQLIPQGNTYLSSDFFNPFARFFLLSHPVPSLNEESPRYQKGWSDLLFIAYYVVFWSLIRQSLSIYLLKPMARYYGIKREQKLDRFAEQGYAVVYFAVMGAWGYRIMGQLPTWWYRTEAFWIDYPHWDMKPELKRYYLMQMAYWVQQLLVLVLGLEKPRKDYYELVAHHIVTIWLVGWSYLINLTLIGNAVYMSMDIPDTFLAFSKILNYLQAERAKIVSFVVFTFVWTYFRHILNFYILYSVWFEYDLTPESSKVWIWADGTYLNWWMKYQVFAPLLLLQFLNLFWYFLIMRIAYRAMTSNEVSDERSDDEDDGEAEDDEEDTVVSRSKKDD